ncbi:MAG: S9 family peptidase [Pseudonocardiaceae bacterium]
MTQGGVASVGGVPVPESSAAVLPFGSWPTPITSELVVSAAVRLREVRVDGADVVWSEGRAAEGGRTQLVRRAADGTTEDLLPDGMNARTAVHEYGGAGWWVRDGVVWFTEWTDQRLYRLDTRAAGVPLPITPEPTAARGDRYADGELSPDGEWIVCIREHHPPGGRGAVDVRNEIVRLPAHPPRDEAPVAPEVLVSGPDFVSSPRWRGDGGALCWISWEHPSMPWDDTVLTVRELASGVETVVAGGPGESVSQPCWQPDGSLWFVSDRTGWWNLYRWTPDGEITPMVQMSAEIGEPGWGLGSSRYVVLSADNGARVVFARWSGGYDGLAVRLADATVTDLPVPFSMVSMVRRAGDDAVIVVAATPTTEPAVYRVELPGPVRPAGSVAPLRPARDLDVDPGYLSVPEPIDFPSVDALGGPRTAHGLFYPPANPAYRGPPGARPPLVVVIHGGPTATAMPVLNVAVQYWTSRGFAVVDVNYGGSTGYGRTYRELLRGAWGVVDVADCVAAARWLAAQGRVDVERLCIRGGSAGGYTTLAALAREDTPFTAGADHYGVADLEALATGTHKFESRYLDGLIGKYPEQRDVYVARSPINQVHRFNRPLIVLQGLEDEVVPPDQSTMIVDALRAKGVPVAYLPFEGEQHGFRRAENIRRALDGELSFYAQVFGFPLPAEEGIEPIEVLRHS